MLSGSSHTHSLLAPQTGGARGLISASSSPQFWATLRLAEAFFSWNSCRVWTEGKLYSQVCSVNQLLRPKGTLSSAASTTLRLRDRTSGAKRKQNIREIVKIKVPVFRATFSNRSRVL